MENQVSGQKMCHPLIQSTALGAVLGLSIISVPLDKLFAFLGLSGLIYIRG